MLRPPAEGDQAVLLAAAADPQVRRFTRLPERFGPAEADEVVVGAARRRHLGASLELAICADGAQHARGMIGLVVDRHDGARAEVGYWVAAADRGRGWATAALTLLTEWALGEAGFVRVDLEASRRNPASQRVARRAGFVREGLARAAWPAPDGRHDVVLFARLADDPPPQALR